jgi:virulence factor Mce-like protein
MRPQPGTNLIRRLVLILGVVAGVALVAVVVRSGSQSAAGYRVNVIFDDARGLVAGQLVKVAGAKVGTIRDVRLTAAFKANVGLTVDRRFAPFRANATCTIRPEGLIAENYVECDPGTQDNPALPAATGGVPTVPVAHTTEPVNLTDLFNIFSAPTRERLSVIVNELGIATAGRGADINEIIRRANPSLALTRRALSIVDGQRTQLASAIDQSDRLIAKLAQRSQRTQDFLVSAAAVSGRIARHHDALSQAVARLPGLLGQGRGALQSLDTLTAAGTPLLRSLLTAAPDLNRVSTDIPAFAAAAPPALAGLGRALTQGTSTARRLLPVVLTVRRYATSSLSNALLSGQLYGSLRDRGFFENLLAVLYYGAAATARYDAISHILPAHVLVSPCLAYATTPTAGCSAQYSSAARNASSRRPTARVPRAPGARGPSLPGPAPATPQGNAPGPSASVPSAPPVPQPLIQVLNYLLGR